MVDFEEIARSPEAALSYIHGVSWLGSKPGLSRTRALLARLGDPQAGLRFAHVAGTNGKGSTAAMLASVLQRAGYRTGLYTSPYLSRFNERMCVDGEPITDGELAELTAQAARQAEAMADHPTEFELVTAIGMLYFARRRCDIVVLEVGMGGALDSTNVIDPPEVAVIANLGLDHTQYLGGTMAEIAAAKAGIIKAGSRVALYDLHTEPAAREVVHAACRTAGVPLYEADFTKLCVGSDDLSGQTFAYRDTPGLHITLLGEHQARNAALVYEAVTALREAGWRISDTALRQGYVQARWPGRFELLRRHPVFLCDGGHNPQCAQALSAALARYFPGERFIFVTGVMADKDYAGVFAPLMPLAERFITVRPDNPRALPAQELAAFLTGGGVPAEAADSPEAGVDRALELAGPGGRVCSFGSLYMTGAIRTHVLAGAGHSSLSEG